VSAAARDEAQARRQSGASYMQRPCSPMRWSNVRVPQPAWSRPQGSATCWRSATSGWAG